MLVLIDRCWYLILEAFVFLKIKANIYSILGNLPKHAFIYKKSFVYLQNHLIDIWVEVGSWFIWIFHVTQCNPREEVMEMYPKNLSSSWQLKHALLVLCVCFSQLVHIFTENGQSMSTRVTYFLLSNILFDGLKTTNIILGFLN